MKRLLPVLTLSLLLLTACGRPPGSGGISSLDSYHRALQLVSSAKDALGQIGPGQGIYLEGEGTYDLSTRMQGLQPDTPEPYPISEKLAVDPESGRVAYESDTHVNADAREWIRYIYDGQNRMLFLERYAGLAFWNSRPGLNRQGRRYSNMIPHLLLEEALASRASLRYLGTDNDENELVSFTSATYGPLTLYFDSDSRYLSGIDYLKDIPLLGDTAVRWRFKAYDTVAGIGPYPTGYTVTLNGKKFKDITYTAVQAGLRNAEVLNVPENTDVPEMPDTPTGGEPEPPVSASPVRDPVKLSEGVHVFSHIRSGFHPMVIEFHDYLMVIDTPAGWLEMQQLPAMQWVGGASSSSTGRRLLTAIREKLPGKPIRYVALTHHHSDHAGGIRPFIAAGATILASAVTASVVEQAAKNRCTLEPDELTGSNITPDIEIVDGERTISDGDRKVRLIDVGDNPHAEGMLVAYLPRKKILYQSDLFEPTNMNFFPNKSRLPVMQWFVDWLDRSGLDVERIYAIHAGLVVMEEHLETIRSTGH